MGLGFRLLYLVGLGFRLLYLVPSSVSSSPALGRKMAKSVGSMTKASLGRVFPSPLLPV